MKHFSFKKGKSGDDPLYYKSPLLSFYLQKATKAASIKQLLHSLVRKKKKKKTRL
jgi:hypothetical protein